MINAKKSKYLLNKFVSNASGFPWLEFIDQLWKIGRKIIQGLANQGMYEVLEYESTLELLDDKGKRASFQKRMKVRFLQNEIIAFQDYAWGDGDILRNYKTGRGRVVDRYRSGYKTYILLSLREVKNRGDIDEFNISWGIRNGFLTTDGYWATNVSHRMKQVRVNMIFPKSRPPQRLFLEETNRRKTRILEEKHIKQLADGRWRVSWKTEKAKLHEIYTIRWDW